LAELRPAPLCGTKVAQPPLSDRRHRVDARAGCRSEAHREHTEQRLAALKASGITLALDDFGTGYASLSYLRRFPVDIVKIDRSFTDGIDSATADLVLLKGIIDLGNALGLNLVAEGIQTHAQHENRPRPRLPQRPGLLLRLPRRRGAPRARRQSSVGGTLQLELSHPETGDLELHTDSQRIAFVRVLQESLSNIAKHADAANVTIQLRDMQHSLLLQVRDDGRGFQSDDCCRSGTTHIGLDAMRERLQVIGSTLTVDSRAGGPTTITAVIEKWQPPLNQH